MGNINQYLIIDGSALLHRAYHALPDFSSAEGVPTNALFGFIKMTLSLLNKIEPQYLSVAFDTPVPTFRKKLLASYQAQRPKADEAFKVQIPLVQEFLRLAKIPLYLKEGYEADDVIATITHLALVEQPGLQVKIVTGDKDILQLVNKQVMVLMPKSGVSNLFYLDEEAVKEKLGITSEQVVDYKALVGDPSDNYGGIKGVGPKTAIKLLSQYQTLENIYQHLNNLETSLKLKLESNQQQALLSKQLAKLVSNVEINYQLAQAKYKQLVLDEALRAFCERYNLHSLKKQLQQFAKTEKEAKLVDKTEANQLSFF